MLSTASMHRPPSWLVCLAGILFLTSPPGAQAKRQAPSGPPATGPGSTADLSSIAIEPEALDFGPVGEGSEASLEITLRNTGFATIDLRRVRFLLGTSGNSSSFSVTIAGKTYAGGVADTNRQLSPSVILPRGQEIIASVTFEPVSEQLDSFVLRFEGDADFAEIPVSGLGGHSGDPFLHVVIDGPDFAVDYDGSGAESLLLDGSGSHTHEPGHTLAGYTWRIGGSTVSTSTALSTTLALGETEVELEIADDNVPPHTLAGHADVRVVHVTDVPGVLTEYFDASSSGAGALLDDVPGIADFVEQRPSLRVTGSGQVGGSPFDQDVLVRLAGRLQIDTVDTYFLTATGGSDHRIFIDGELVTGGMILSGQHEIEVRFAVDTLSELPLEVFLAGGGNPVGPVDPNLLSHDETDVEPVIHAMTPSGGIAGGTPIAIEGFGFFPPEDVVVHWGNQDLDLGDFTGLSPTLVEFLSPAGGGAIAVTIETGNGPSNVRTFLYQTQGPVPIQFRRDLILTVPSPTAAVWGPDGKLYVSSVDGRIHALDFDEDYQLLSQTTFAGVSGLSNNDTLGLAINPFDPPSPVKLYVSHGKHFVNGGVPPTGPSPYTGQISVLTSPGFASPSALVTGLPVSNHDHGMNGIAFDNNGDLLISVGSATNAGVKDPDSGDLPESPLSAAVLKARLSEPGFNGTVTYVHSVTGLPNDDQRFGEEVDLAPGSDVDVHATGLRNAYGLLYTTTGRLYATDNGPNVTFGPASTGPSTQTADPYDDDEIDLIEWGNYYGSPNRCRGRTDARQNVYYAGFSGPGSIADTFTQMIGWAPPSSDGIDEYRADTFQGQIRGNLIIQEYLSKLRRVRLKPDGRGILSQTVIDPLTSGLSCVTGPGGAIVSLDYVSSQVEVLEADDLTPLDLVVHDIFPWRAPASGGTPFVIGGHGFGTLASTAVTIGGHTAVLTDVSWARIEGLVPEEIDPTTALVDVQVTVGSNSDTLSQAFRFLPGPGLEPGRWESLASVGTAVGEVAGGVINGVLYLVGEGSSTTFAYDLLNRQWLAAKATRPFPGSHHSAEVLDGKLFLVGGLSGGSEGKLQIYDPVTNTWESGSDMPWGGGSVSTAVIDDKLYACGGIVGTFTVNNCAYYDRALDTWTNRATMPDGGRNHAAAATDGAKLYAFGGRRGGNFVANGYDSLMVYTPATNTWTWNGAAGSTLAPLPEARGGMGKAVYLRGEFYVFGGETLDDPDANASGVYDRVDVYSPATNSWRAEAAMPNPRHGIFPVLFQGHVFLAGGGTQAAFSLSDLFDTFTRQ